jgi:hypothetical protein
MQSNWAENTAESERRRPDLIELLEVGREATLIYVQFDLSLSAEIIWAELSTAEQKQCEPAFLSVTQPH